MNTQQLASILRQIAAVASIVMGAITAAVNSNNAIHLPPAVSAVLAAAGGLLLSVEHYVGDPSTGTVTTTVPTTIVPTTVETPADTIKAAPTIDPTPTA